MQHVEKIVTVLTGVALFALVINYPTVPLRAVSAIATLTKEVIGLATPTSRVSPAAQPGRPAPGTLL